MFISSQITIFLFTDEELILLILLYVIKPVLSSEIEFSLTKTTSKIFNKLFQHT